MKKFDLNIERILEDWETHHAIREIIANALDEQLLTKTKEVEIYKNGNYWIVRDYGRGLKYSHLTQNENQEKLNNNNVIGKFGIGLKDAFATFDRKGILVEALSKHGKITISKSEKEGFKDINTLHAVIEESDDENFQGTLFKFQGVSEKEIENAKRLFLKFSGEKIIENTSRGQIIERSGEYGNIYINGVKVAEEENFLFSYNITVLNAAIKKALNRERTNVGRTAYTNSVKSILLNSGSKEVAESLGNDLININKGTAKDELSWIDIQEHAVKILNQEGEYLFVSSYEAMQYPDMMDQAKNGNHQIIIIPENLKLKIQNSEDFLGQPIVDIEQFASDYNDSFEFDFVNISQLSSKEREIYQLTPQIIKLFGGLPQNVEEIKISNTMQKDFFSEIEVMGCWDSSTSYIVLARKTLNSVQSYSGTLIHELIHAKTGYADVTRNFEIELTDTIGHLCNHYFKRNKEEESIKRKGGIFKKWFR
ncbi:MAG TPA: ATP-binding protein [Chitinophagaceae bacterium]|nr:ATP-binding protein [Chitinophagaceae bacterium]